MLLSLALLHGLNGVRWSIDDYVRDRARRATVKAVVYLLSAVLFAYGTFSIVTFSA
jgi:succinate dehydrogenase / fumarate reductase membrane anchor subunit